MTGNLYFLIACPRSGKSTFAKEWLYDIYNEGFKPRVVLAGDSFREAIHEHAYINRAEGLVFATMDVAIKALLLDGYDVLVDDTHTSEASILRMLRLDINAEPIFIDTPTDVCVERAHATGRPYLVGPIKRMAEQLSLLKADWPANFERLKQYLRDRQDNDVVCTIEDGK